MVRSFNVTGACDPQLHYMVNIQDKLEQIKKMVDSGAYFTINRARQYGKTTTLKALADYLKNDYVVIPLDFQRLGNEEFETAGIFCEAFLDYLVATVRNKKCPIHGLDEAVLGDMEAAASDDKRISLRKLFYLLSSLCDTAEKPVVLMIDEVDSATNNQVFLDFLAQLRLDYINRKTISTFQSVILAGVYDVRNIKRKIRPEEEHKVNSPWNIATDFLVNMSFMKDEIEGMLKDYEADFHTGMDTGFMAGLIYDYTSGYPYLVSRYCKLIDERVAGTEAFPDKTAAWTKEGFLEAEKIMLFEKTTLFESLINKLLDYPELNNMLYHALFTGERVTYNPDNTACQLGVMFGLIKNDGGALKIANRTFETRLYDYFMSNEQLEDASYLAASRDKNQFIRNGKLDMDLVLHKFVEHFHDVYGDKDQAFVEKYGRKFFLLYLKPIINGTGHYYIEAETRDAKRTDVIVDYRGEQFIIELKLWDGPKYHQEGEEQLLGYLEQYRLDKGYLLTFSFKQGKTIGVEEVSFGNRTLLEATV